MCELYVHVLVKHKKKITKLSYMTNIISFIYYTFNIKNESKYFY